jgi:hypothetical protein
MVLCGGCALQDVKLREPTTEAGSESDVSDSGELAADGGEPTDAGQSGNDPDNGPLDPACVDSVCEKSYACVPLEASYTCRGQFADWQPAYTATAFAITEDDVVTDSRSGLVWQRHLPELYAGCTGAVDEMGAEGAGCNWRESVRYCKDLTLANGGWRLPTKAELESLIDDTRSHPTIDVDLFPDTRSHFYWTVSPFVEQPQHFYAIGFETGFSKFDDADTAYFVRCVR